MKRLGDEFEVGPPISPFHVAPVHALLTYLWWLVLLTVPARILAQTSVQPGQFGVKLRACLKSPGSYQEGWVSFARLWSQG